MTVYNQVRLQQVLLKRTLAVLTILGCYLVPEYCSAQIQRYQPRRPTTSPYLNLTRFNDGGIPNYYSLVRPEQQQRSYNLQEQALRQQQSRTLGRLQTDLRLGRPPVVTTGIGSRYLTPGTRSYHLDSSRYYQQPIIGRRLGR